MLRIREAKITDLPTIEKLAHQTWPDTFKDILSKKQIAYMLNWMYSQDSLQEQVLQKEHRFLLAEKEQQAVGFASFEVNYKGQPKTKIHKIYVLPETQGTGAGRKLMDAVATAGLENQNTVLTLNVNRFNKAVEFYKRYGFQITAQEDIDIGNGFLMEDFVMEKQLK